MELQRILLIDDNPRDVELLLHALDGLSGEAVRVGQSGAEALRLIAQQMPQLVILDLDMPEMNGLDVLSTLRSHPQTQNLPVLILSSSGEEADMQRCYDQGASAYMVKPLYLSELREAITAMCDYWGRLNERSA